MSKIYNGGGGMFSFSEEEEEEEDISKPIMIDGKLITKQDALDMIDQWPTDAKNKPINVQKLLYLVRAFLHIRDVLLAALYLDGNLIFDLKGHLKFQKYKNDKEIFYVAMLESQNKMDHFGSNCYYKERHPDFISDELLYNDPYIINYLLEIDLKICPFDFISYRPMPFKESVLKEVLAVNGLALKYVTMRKSRNNKEHVLIAIRQNPQAFIYMSDELKRDMDFVILVVAENKGVVPFISREIKDVLSKHISELKNAHFLHELMDSAGVKHKRGFLARKEALSGELSSDEDLAKADEAEAAVAPAHSKLFAHNKFHAQNIGRHMAGFLERAPTRHDWATVVRAAENLGIPLRGGKTRQKCRNKRKTRRYK